jgi:hypothetical protein
MNFCGICHQTHAKDACAKNGATTLAPNTLPTSKRRWSIYEREPRAMEQKRTRNKAASKESCKIRVIYIYRMLLSEPDYITCATIMRRLENQFDIRVDRKTIYDDIRSINRILPIQTRPGMKGGFKRWDFSEV